MRSPSQSLGRLAARALCFGCRGKRFGVFIGLMQHLVFQFYFALLVTPLLDYITGIDELTIVQFIFSPNVKNVLKIWALDYRHLCWNNIFLDCWFNFSCSHV